MGKEITIDGVVYVPKGSIKELAINTDGMQFRLVRTRDAGVWFGWIKKEEGDTVVMVNSRNIHYWATGTAAALPQIANDGIKNNKDNRITQAVIEKKLFGVIDITVCTKKAQDNLLNQPIWEM